MIEALSPKWLQREWDRPRVGARLHLLGESLGKILCAGWRRLCAAQQAMRTRSERRSLRVAESVSLGDKRSVYLIEVDGQRMLLGASAAGVTLLSHLSPAKETQLRTVKEPIFADVMEGCATGKAPKRKPRAAPAAQGAG